MIKCLFYRHNRADRKEEIPAARMPFYGFTFLFEGELEYAVDGKKIRLLPGDAVFLPKGCVRAREGNDLTRHISFHFETDEAPDLPVYLPGATTPAIRRLLSAFDEIASECPGPEDERFGAFLALLIALLRAGIRSEREDPVVLAVRRYLLENLDRKVTLADVGRAVSFSPNHCQAVFRRATGRSIIDTLLDLRIKKAKELISSGEYRLRDVAEKVGFEDYNYFSRVFRSRCGASPSRYRRLFS